MTSPHGSAVEAPEYQSLSVLAVVALVLGAASVAALAVPLLLVLAAAAIGCGLLALSAIRRSDGAMTGAAMARLGMAVAVAATAAYFVRGALRDSLLRSQAETAAQTWIETLAAGRFEDARDRLSRPALNSLLPDPMTRTTPLTAAEADEISLRRLRDDPLSKALAGEAVVLAEGASAPAFDGPRTLVTADFAVGVPGGLHRHAQVHLVRDRRDDAGGQPWRIDAWSAGEAHGAH